MFTQYCDYMIKHNNVFFRSLSRYVDSAIDYEHTCSSILDFNITSEKVNILFDIFNIILTNVKYDETSEFHLKYSLLFIYKYLGLFYEYCESHYTSHSDEIKIIVQNINGFSDNKLTVKQEFVDDLTNTGEYYITIENYVIPDGLARNETIRYLQGLTYVQKNDSIKQS